MTKFSQKYLLLILIILNTVVQSQNLNEQLFQDTDVPTYINIGNSILSGNLPYETTWEGKGPLFYILFSFVTLLTNGQVLYIKIFRILLYNLVLIVIFNYGKKITSDPIKLLFPALTFVLFINSFSFGGSLYYEFFICLFLYLIFEKSKSIIYKPILSGIIFGALGQIVIISNMFIAPFMFKVMKNNKQKMSYLLRFSFGYVAFIGLVYFIFLMNNLGEIYLFTNFEFPLLYGNAEYGYDVGITTLFFYIFDNESIYLFAQFSLIAIAFIFYFFKQFEIYINNNFYRLVLLIVTYLFPIFVDKLYGHHWIYFLFFLCLYLNNYLNIKNKLLSFVFLIFPLWGSAVSLSHGINQILGINSLEFKSEVLVEKLKSENIKIEKALVWNIQYIITQLDATTPLYIQHPTFINKENSKAINRINELTGTVNDLEYQISQKPDLIICSEERYSFCSDLKGYYLYEKLIFDNKTLNVYLLIDS